MISLKRLYYLLKQKVILRGWSGPHTLCLSLCLLVFHCSMTQQEALQAAGNSRTTNYMALFNL